MLKDLTGVEKVCWIICCFIICFMRVQYHSVRERAKKIVSSSLYHQKYSPLHLASQICILSCSSSSSNSPLLVSTWLDRLTGAWHCLCPPEKILTLKPAMRKASINRIRTNAVTQKICVRLHTVAMFIDFSPFTTLPIMLLTLCSWFGLLLWNTKIPRPFIRP